MFWYCKSEVVILDGYTCNTVKGESWFINEEIVPLLLPTYLVTVTFHGRAWMSFVFLFFFKSVARVECRQP